MHPNGAKDIGCMAEDQSQDHAKGASVIFQTREEAGRQLAARLRTYQDAPDGLILALPRGGVPLGHELSIILHLPLDVFITRKIGAPFDPEYALGAVSETGNVYLNPDFIVEFGGSSPVVADLVNRERREIARRQTLYRQGRHPLPIHDRLVIVVDDGIATGATFLASVEAIRSQGPKRLVGAIPVGPREAIAKARAVVDELIVLSTPEPFWSVGSHYAQFAQLDDRKVLEYLHSAEQFFRKGRKQAPTVRV